MPHYRINFLYISDHSIYPMEAFYVTTIIVPDKVNAIRQWNKFAKQQYGKEIRITKIVSIKEH